MAGIELKGFDEAKKMLDKLPDEVSFKILPKGLKAVAQVVQKASEQKAPRSKQTGTWNTQSKATKEKSPAPLAETIVLKSIKYISGVALAVVGPSWPLGAHGWLVEHGHRARFWGRPSTGAIVQGKAWFAPVVDSTRSQQETAMLKTVESEIAKIK